MQPQNVALALVKQTTHLRKQAWFYTITGMTSSWYNSGSSILLGAQHYYAVIGGTGAPTVLFDAGLSCSAATWSLVATVVQHHVRCCAIDRAGVGRSSAGPLPRTIHRIVDELHQLLNYARLPPPYLLVGHSFGGMTLRLFAAHHPTSIAGMLLLDTPHPELIERAAALLPNGTWLHEMQQWNSENVDLTTSFAHLRAAAPLPNVPTTILTARQATYPSGWPVAALEQVRLDSQVQLAHSIPHSQHRIVECGHNMHTERPEIVVAAIMELVEQTINDVGV